MVRWEYLIVVASVALMVGMVWGIWTSKRLDDDE
jgi:uncharacterized protein YneF (UPF0154 family)